MVFLVSFRCAIIFPFLFWGSLDDAARHLLTTTGKDYICMFGLRP